MEDEFTKILREEFTPLKIRTRGDLADFVGRNFRFLYPEMHKRCQATDPTIWQAIFDKFNKNDGNKTNG